MHDLHKYNVEQAYESFSSSLERYSSWLRSGRFSRMKWLLKSSSTEFNLAELEYLKERVDEMWRRLECCTDYFIEAMEIRLSGKETVSVPSYCPSSSEGLVACLMFGDRERAITLCSLQMKVKHVGIHNRDKIDDPDILLPYNLSQMHLILGERQSGQADARKAIEILEKRILAGDILYTGFVDRARLVSAIAENRQDDLSECWKAAYNEYEVAAKEDGYYGAQAGLWMAGLSLLRLNEIVNGQRFVPDINDRRLPIDLVFG